MKRLRACFRAWFVTCLQSSLPTTVLAFQLLDPSSTSTTRNGNKNVRNDKHGILHLLGPSGLTSHSSSRGNHNNIGRGLSVRVQSTKMEDSTAGEEGEQEEERGTSIITQANNITDDDTEIDNVENSLNGSATVQTKDDKDDKHKNDKDKDIQLTPQMEQKMNEILQQRIETESASKQKLIEELVQQNEKGETSRNRLRFRLMEIKSNLEESEDDAVLAEGNVKELEDELEVLKERERVELEELKDQFRKEKEENNNLLASLTQSIEETIESSNQKLQEIQTKAQQDIEQLKQTISTLGSSLTSQKEEAKSTKERITVETERLESTKNKRLTSSANLLSRIETASSYERSKLSSRLEELQSELTIANERLSTVTSKRDHLSSTVRQMERKLKQMDEEFESKLYDIQTMEEKEAERQTRRRETDTKRIRGLVFSFTKRMKRREEKVKSELESVEMENRSKVDATREIQEKIRENLIEEEREEVSEIEGRLKEELGGRRSVFDEIQGNLTRTYDGIVRDRDVELEKLREETTKVLDAVDIEKGIAIAEIILEKDAQIQRLEMKLKSEYTEYEMDKVNQLILMKEERDALEAILKERIDTIDRHVMERGSARALLGLMVKVSRERVMNVVRRGGGRKNEEEVGIK